MNRFVSVLLVALCLAAVGLAQPAQAQSQWVQGQLYYDQSNIADLDDNHTTTLTTKPLGLIKLKSTPTAYGSPGSYAHGTVTGIIHQDYLWVGDPNSPGTSFTSTDNGIIYGGFTGTGSASSNVADVYGSTNYQTQTYSRTSTVGPPLKSFSGNTSTTVTRSYTLGLATTEYYTGFAYAAVTVTFGPPS